MSSTYNITRHAARLDLEAAERSQRMADMGILLLPVVQWVGMTNLNGNWATAAGVGLGAAAIGCGFLHNHFFEKASKASRHSYEPSPASLERAKSCAPA